MANIQKQYNSITLVQRIIIWVLSFIVLFFIFDSFMYRKEALMISAIILGLIISFFEIGRKNNNQTKEH